MEAILLIDIQGKRKIIIVDYELPMGEKYGSFIRELLEQEVKNA